MALSVLDIFPQQMMTEDLNSGFGRVTVTVSLFSIPGPSSALQPGK
jgi:hypothetical protein